MPSPTYDENKKHQQKWVNNNRATYNIVKLRCYYRNKIKCPLWREAKYEFLAILRD